jgi:hypothetical protein
MSLADDLTAKLRPALLGLPDKPALSAWIGTELERARLKLEILSLNLDANKTRDALEAWVRVAYYSEAQEIMVERPESISVDDEGDVDLGDPIKRLLWLERQEKKWKLVWDGLTVLPPGTGSVRSSATVSIPTEVVF